MIVLSPLRAGKITGSRIAGVLGISPYQSREGVLRELVREHFHDTPEFTGNVATDWGNDHEADALAEYETTQGVRVHSRQQFILHPEHLFLAVTVDALVGDDGLAEAKCPYRATYTHISQRPDFDVQIRLQLACTGRAWGDLAVWTPSGFAVSRVEADPWWLDSVMPQLVAFMDEFRAVIADEELAAPYRAPLVDERTDPEWRQAALDYLDAYTAQKTAEGLTADARARLLELAAGRPCRGAGVLVSRSERAGQVDWREALSKYTPDADPDDFRGQPKVIMTVRQSA